MIAYNKEELEKLEVINEAEKWHKSGIIDDAQFENIQSQYESNLYHPPFWLRVILFIATIVGVYATLGLFGTLMISGFRNLEEVIRVILVAIGVGSFLYLEAIAIKTKHHYKSGVTEALLYMGISNGLMGVFGFDLNEYFYAFLILLVGVIAAVRYLNLLGVVTAVSAVAFFVFTGLYDLGGILKSTIPFAFIIVFSTGYMISQRFQETKNFPFYKDVFIILDVLFLVLVFAGGNYFVVRELSFEMMGLNLVDGEDIPFGWLFHITTAVIPLIYLYFGIKNKKPLLLRVALLLLFASVITFKYYYSTGHPEISLTIAGAFILGITIWTLNFLKTSRNGFTREKLLSDKWDNINAESILVSSTLGGNAIPTEAASTDFGGGEFGGGGAGGEF